VGHVEQSEVHQWICNDRVLERQFISFVENYTKKIEKGVFTKPLAKKGLLILVKAGITSYNKRYGRGSVTLTQIEKEQVASAIFDDMWVDFLSHVRKTPVKKPKTRAKATK
jgi:hypothetical protein